VAGSTLAVFLLLGWSSVSKPAWRRGRRGKGSRKRREEVGAPGGPRVQLNATVAEPPLVVRLREALPPTAQTEMNSVSDAIMN
jgi:hypothetical protein